MSRDKRRYPRIGPVLVRAECHLGERSWEGFLTSLSEGGAYLVTNEELDVGDRLSLYFDLPLQLGTIDVAAESVYIISEADAKPDGYPSGAGLAFVATTVEQLKRLQEYVTRFQALALRLSSADSLSTHQKDEHCSK